MRYEFVAISRESSGSFSMYFNIETVEDARVAFAEFEKSVPFAKYYYELISDEHDFCYIDELIYEMEHGLI
jgi:hypothetical protein